MQLYEMQVSKTAITRTAAAKVPCGVIGAVVRFSFSQEWEGLSKTVVFRAGDVSKDILGVEEFAVIPAECTQELGQLLEVGVYGVDAENTVAIPTMWEAIGRITEATDPSGDTSTDTALPVWAQLQERIRLLEETGVSQEDVEKAIRSYFTRNPITAEDIGAVPTHRKINNKELTGDINLTAGDVGARPGNWKPDKYDVGLGNLDNVRQYSASNPPPYPVTSVNGNTGAVVLGATDVGAAPTGFGLGGICVNTDWNNATANGWYAGKINGNWWVGVVSTYGGSVALFIHQRVYQVAYSDSGEFMVSMERKGYDITGNRNYTWTEWEYINPPMMPGVEYRTTERSGGLPVYTKTFALQPNVMTSFGIGEYDHGITGFKHLCRVEARTENYVLPLITNERTVCIAGVTATKVKIAATKQDFTDYTSITLWYTKN